MTLRTLNYGNYGIFLNMGNAGFCPSAVVPTIKLKVQTFLGLMNSTAKVLRHVAVLTADGVESWAYFGHPCFCSVVFGYSGFRAWFLAYRFRAWAKGGFVLGGFFPCLRVPKPIF